MMRQVWRKNRVSTVDFVHSSATPRIAQTRWREILLAVRLLGSTTFEVTRIRRPHPVRRQRVHGVPRRRDRMPRSCRLPAPCTLGRVARDEQRFHLPGGGSSPRRISTTRSPSARGFPAALTAH